MYIVRLQRRHLRCAGSAVSAKLGVAVSACVAVTLLFVLHWLIMVKFLTMKLIVG